MNLTGEQLVGHRVLISEEESYQKKALIILVLIIEIQEQTLYEKFNCLNLHTCSTPRLNFNKYVNMSVFFSFMSIFMRLTDSYDYHFPFKYRCAEKHLNLSFYFTH